MKKGKVYLLANWDLYQFKIGVTSGDVEKRVKQLQTGNGSEIDVVRVFESEYYRKIEKILHRGYGHKRLEGEWFALEDEDIFGFIGECEQAHNNIKMLIEMGNPFI